MSVVVSDEKSANSEMNVTPLIDVLLVLLIIFMVLPHHFGERVEVPQTKEIVPIPYPEPVVIQLSENGIDNTPTLHINHDTVAWDSLETRLQSIYAGRIDRAAFLKGDPEIDFRYVVQVVDMAHHAGVDQIGLLGAND